MKRWTMALALVLSAAGVVFAHPGMTDRFDGHKCFKKCENWGILYGEYHLHDKDRKPIRVEKKLKPRRSDNREQVAAPNAGNEAQPAAPPPVAAAPKIVVVREESVLAIDPFLLILLALLILLLILRMNRKREEREAGR